MEPGRRKQLGAWYTPAALVDHVVERTLHREVGHPARPWRVLDPACGDGRFLTAAALASGGDAHLTGVDIDRATANATALALPPAQILRGDALVRRWGARRFDVIVGNPPFLNQMATATTRTTKSRFGGGAYADVAADFLALSVSLLAPGGRVGLVLPQSILTTRDVEPIRRFVRDRAALVHIWWSPTLLFDAQVRTCALVFEAGALQGVVTRSFGPHFEPYAPTRLGASWGSLLLDEPEPEAVSATAPTLGDIATFTVDFRDQYYGLVPAVADDVDGPPFVTSGVIEPGRSLWGERPVTFAKQRFAAPRVALDRLSPKMQRWAATRLVPKILIANQTRTIEAVVDREGAWLPGVPVISCTSTRLDEVHRVLSSPAATTWVRHRAAGSGLSYGTMRLSPSLLAGIPLTGDASVFAIGGESTPVVCFPPIDIRSPAARSHDS